MSSEKDSTPSPVDPGLCPDPNAGGGFAGGLAKRFINSKLTPLAIIASIILGLVATLLLPREEEPQIKVPMIDVMVSMPGAGSKEVENRVTRPMEKFLWEIPGVEYIYSTSSPGRSLVIVRFKVGSDMERSLVKLNQKLQTNYDKIPPGVSPPLVKPKSIDDVPILALTFHGKGADHLTLRRLVSQVDEYVKQVPDVAETNIIGGDRSEVRVILDPVKLTAYGLTAADVVPMLTQANQQARDDSIAVKNKEFIVETGGFFHNATDVGNVVLAVRNNKPVYVHDVARIVDGPADPTNYVFYGSGHHPMQAAVTLSIAKRPGTNAVTVVGNVLKKIHDLKGSIIPDSVHVSVTRDYGKTASDKSNELLYHMGIAVVSVALLIFLFLGWRESLVVLVAIPATLGLTLLVFYLYGYTLNRITLFALIFSIGILVDDAIVVVENIVRHVNLRHNRDRPIMTVAVEAVAEVGNPTVLATWAVIAAILPMAFVGGLMGPYMRPIPVGSSAAMLFSLIVAFVVTPWAAVRVLFFRRPRNKPLQNHEDKDTALTRFYRKVMHPLINNAVLRWSFLGVVTLLLLGSVSLVAIGWVKVKMLPFDNKSEFQVIINMPEGTTLEKTAAVAREMAASIQNEPDVHDYEIYAGTSSPYNFNGLVRHYFLRRGPNVADIQVNLVPKDERRHKSHEIAVSLRPRLAAIAKKNGGRVVVAEVPPGPPVLQTLVAEIYGPNHKDRVALARKVMSIFQSTKGVVDVDWYEEANQQQITYIPDKTKAALNGISTAQIVNAIAMATGDRQVGILHQPEEREDVPVVVTFPRGFKNDPNRIESVRIRSAATNKLVPLSELVTVKRGIADKSIYHKNLMPVIYVTGDVAGVIESPVYAILKMDKRINQLDAHQYGGTTKKLTVYNYNMPFDDLQPSMKWDGEWHITIEVFRDLGLAFAAVLILIYMLMVGWFRSFITPFVVMAAIPFSLVGILPAHGLLGAFFTATSMIGFMAGGGIVVRNSIILVDFIELRLKQGMPLAEAVIDAGAVRFRPMLLTALAVVVAASVILADPIFQGLAISLMAGELASLAISFVAVPIMYYILHPKIER